MTRPDDPPSATADDEIEPKAQANDSDTTRPTEPKGQLGAEPKPGARRFDDGGGTDTGSGGGPKTGLVGKRKTGN
jgi:hypothetical protein